MCEGAVPVFVRVAGRREEQEWNHEIQETHER
jgi:hypothetical protein